MGRWEVGSRERMTAAALELFAQQGFERTTGGEIAARAGLTERTFFRHFTDKRDVLFDSGERLEAVVTRSVATAPSTDTPADVVRTAFRELARELQGNRDQARMREAVIAEHAELRERERTKRAGIETALLRALHQRGVDMRDARLAAGVGVAVFTVALNDWLEGATTDLQGRVSTAFDDASHLFHDMRPSSGTS